MSGNALRLLTLLLAVNLGGTCSGESLTDAWKVALSGDLRAKAMQNMSEAAQLNLSAARGHRLPTFSLEAAYTKLDSTPSISLSLPQLGKMEMPIADDSFGFSRAMVTLPLYTHGKISSRTSTCPSLSEAHRRNPSRMARVNCPCPFVGFLSLPMSSYTSQSSCRWSLSQNSNRLRAMISTLHYVQYALCDCAIAQTKTQTNCRK